MDGQMDGLMNESMDRWMCDGKLDVLIDGRTDEWKERLAE